MITMLLFDIHEVVLLRSQKRYAAVATRFGVTSEALTNAIHGTEAQRTRDGFRLWDHYKCGRLNEEAYWGEVAAELKPDFQGNPMDLCDAMDFVDEVNEELVACIRTLQSAYQIAALSNAGADLERRIQHFHLDTLFHPVINSHRVGVAKPDAAIYQLTLDTLQVPPEEILFVDDRERNTVVAERMGFQTHVYTDLERFKSVLNSLSRE